MPDKELYFDASSEESGGSLYRITDQGSSRFLYEHSEYNDETDELKTFRSTYSDFEGFWQVLTQNKEWFYLHPMFVHPDIREFVGAQLQSADWQIQGDAKWQHSHKRQWDKVLSDPSTYYRG